MIPTLPHRLASALALFFFFAATPAFAQEGEGEQKPPEGEAPAQKLPLKRSPGFNSKNLNIPTTLPSLKAVPPRETKVRPVPPPVAQPPPPALPNIGGNPGANKGATPDSDESFANVKAAGGKNCKPLKGTDKVTFDFKGDILELVETISKTTCKNFILTNKVRTQKFEILSPSPITVDEAWRAFLSALEANDFSIIQVGRYYKIIQAADGVRAPVPIYSGSNEAPVDDRMVTVIWKPQHSADVNAVVNYLNIFKSTKGQIHPFAATGTLIVTDFGTSIERLRKVFDEIDQPGALEQVHVVTIQFAGAQEIAEKLTQVFEPKNAAAAAAAGGKSPSRIKMAPQSIPGEAINGTPPPAGGETPEDEGVVSVSKILADERTNKLIIIATDRAFVQIMSLMRELDVPETSGSGQIHVLRLKHANAEELASTLASLAQGKPTTPKAAKPSSGGGKAPAPPPIAAGGVSGATLFEGDVKVTSDKATNSLVITASMADLVSMKRVIEKLDVPRFQVFVEAVIMEVSIKNDRQVGVGWHGGIPNEIDGQQAPILFGNTPTKELSSLAGPLGAASLLGLAGAFSGPTLEGSEDLFGLKIPSFGVVLQALQSTNDVNIISTPHLLTMDNEDAEIQVNEKRPFPSGLTLGGGGGLGALAGLAGQAGGAASGLGNLAGLGLGAVNFNREDIGLTLKLKPQINDEDYVKLEIDQELSDVAGTDQVTGQVITSKRAAKTTVVVRSQDSVVIGGLVRDRETISESKVPLFGDLPLIGWLFKRQAKAVEKVNLLLVLTPYIIRGPADFRTIFERKMAERKEFADRYFGTSAEYQASIDWKRKVGPLGVYRSSMKKELNRAENEGPGDDGETVIREGEKDSKKLEPVQLGPAPDTTPILDPPTPLDNPAVPETPPVEP